MSKIEIRVKEFLFLQRKRAHIYKKTKKLSEELIYVQKRIEELKQQLKIKELHDDTIKKRTE